MKKLSIIFLISLSLLLTSCFKKEEVKVDETPKTEIQKTDTSFDTSSGITENKTTNPTFELISSSGTIEKLKEKIKITGFVKNNEPKLIDAYLSDETEEVSEDDIKNIKSEIPEIDINTLVKFKNSYYYKDKNNIYIEVLGISKVSSIDNKNFRVVLPKNPKKKIISGLLTDGTVLYNYGKKVSNGNLKTIYFKKIGDEYIAGDKNNIYLGWDTLEGGDINSFIKLGEVCYKDNDSLYCMTHCYSDGSYNKIKGNIDLDTVRNTVERYLIDNNGVYSYDEEGYLKKLEQYDSKTFNSLSYYYFINKNLVYYAGNIIEGADIDSFEVLDKDYSLTLYARDKNNIYYEGKVLNGIQDIENFTYSGGIPQDNKCTYKIEGTEAICTPKEIKSSTNLGEIKMIDAYLSDETEEVSEEDKKVFKSGNSAIDLKTLVKFKNSSYYKDDNNIYDLDNFDSILNKIDGVNPKFFKTIQPIGYGYDGTFGYIKYIKTEKVKIDFNSLIIKSFGDELYAGDKDNLYIPPYIYKGDINTLEKIGSCYKDKYNVYCIPCECGFATYELVKGVDVNSFSEVGDYKYIKDKNNLYLYDGTIIQGIKNIESFTFTGGIYQDNKCAYKIEGTKAICTPK